MGDKDAEAHLKPHSSYSEISSRNLQLDIEYKGQACSQITNLQNSPGEIRPDSLSLKYLMPEHQDNEPTGQSLQDGDEKDREPEPEPEPSNVDSYRRNGFWGLYNKYIREWWLFEIISWMFSAIMMSTILIVLVHYDGRETPRFKAGINLSSLLSILASLAKSALLLPTASALAQLKWNNFNGSQSRKMIDFETIDSASHGAWGSFLLLARSKRL
jgi:hypothetical protein